MQSYRSLKFWIKLQLLPLTIYRYRYQISSIFSDFSLNCFLLDPDPQHWWKGLKKFHSWWRRLGDRAEGRELGTLELGAHGCGKSFLAHTTTITNLKYNEHHKESVFLSAGSTGGDMQCSGDEAAQSQCCVQPFHFVSPPAPASQEGGSAPATDIKSTIFYCQKKFRQLFYRLLVFIFYKNFFCFLRLAD